MEKFIVWGEYCEDVINKRKPYREEHLNRLNFLKEQEVLITLGPTKCTRYMFGIFKALNQNYVRELIENDVYWQKGIWISYDIYPWIQAI